MCYLVVGFFVFAVAMAIAIILVAVYVRKGNCGKWYSLIVVKEKLLAPIGLQRYILMLDVEF